MLDVEVGVDLIGASKAAQEETGRDQEIDMIAIASADTRLSAERSMHYIAAFEHRFDSQVRISVEAYDRRIADLRRARYLSAA